MFGNCLHAQNDVGRKCSRSREIRFGEVSEVSKTAEIAGRVCWPRLLANIAKIGEIDEVANIAEIAQIAEDGEIDEIAELPILTRLARLAILVAMLVTLVRLVRLFSECQKPIIRMSISHKKYSFSQKIPLNYSFFAVEWK